MVAQSDWLPVMIATRFGALSGLDQAARPAKGSGRLCGYALEPQGNMRGSVTGCIAGMAPLGNNVGGELIFDEADAVAQHELALFQPLHLQEVRARHVVQSLDGHVEVAMLLLEASQLRPKLALFVLVHASN